MKLLAPRNTIMSRNERIAEVFGMSFEEELLAKLPEGSRLDVCCKDKTNGQQEAVVFTLPGYSYGPSIAVDTVKEISIRQGMDGLARIIKDAYKADEAPDVSNIGQYFQKENIRIRVVNAERN